MAILRNTSKEKFTVIDNNIFKNKKLSLKARGMLTTLLSLPNDWDFNENGLEQIFNDGITAIRSSLRELENNNYLVRNKSRDNKGKFFSEWIISEIPMLENPRWKIQDGKSESENHTQLNTNIKKENICPSNDEQDILLKELADNFDKIWAIYPKKEGKNQAFIHYKAWLKGKKYAGRTIKLTNKQMWLATRKYANSMKEKQVEKQFIKMGSTFFNEAIMEYIEEEK